MTNTQDEENPNVANPRSRGLELVDQSLKMAGMAGIDEMLSYVMGKPKHRQCKNCGLELTFSGKRVFCRNGCEQ